MGSFSRKLLDGIMEIFGVPPKMFRTICSTIVKLDKHFSTDKTRNGGRKKINYGDN
ncbi:hypothetical protein Fmac_026386 [Flemingia macrophylla]|uniref:Uncharacterized protein n=1 Tax=Flemingia macrophylla TaxID=520843 RepID=A0ABD1LEV4_9FABA